MDRRKEQQTNIFEDATLFSRVRLESGNHWVRMSKLVPWDVFEERYAARFENPYTGKPVKLTRMAIASLIIKQ